MSTFKPNPLSALGRMSYSAHLLLYPTLLGVYLLGVKPYMNSSKKKQEEKEWDSMPKARKVDPDLFNPFTAIPYHNNYDLKYVFSHVNMHNYVNKNHINPEEYAWKNFHYSFDHNHDKVYTYNWVSMTGPRE